ncbi:MAG: tetratricopeptide repeat protein [candidate division KSB1 bacterium]|nr:tetratricopeptide repeat protein [candidate division KSB1 bacterium]
MRDRELFDIKKSRTSAVLVFVIIYGIGILCSVSNAQEAKRIKAKRVPHRYELADTTDSINPEILDKTIKHHEMIIAKYPNEPFIPNMMFELAESYASYSQWEFKQRMKQYDEELKKYERGEITIEPVLPRINYKNTIELCYKLFEKFPDIPFKDKVLYRLAICHLDEGNFDRAKEYFQRLIFETPQSQKVSESHFRLGEYYFDRREFQKAIEQYKYLLESWDDPYFNMALYKLGWSYFNINDYPNAISTYIYLISDIHLLETMNTESLGKTKADVKNEAIDYIAHSLTEYGGATMAKQLLSTKETESFAIDVFLRMGEIYKKRNFYADAIATYEALLQIFPLYPNAPLVQKEIIECYEQDMEEEKAIQAKDTFVKKYGPNSQWLSQYPEGKVRNDAIALSQEMLFSLGTYYQAQAQEKNRAREYRMAIEKYEDYIQKFRDSDKTAKVNYYLAECYYAINQFDKAADEYFKVMSQYGDNEFKDAAAYNRILSYYQLLKRNTKVDSTTFYLEDFLGEGGNLIPVKTAHPHQVDLLKACNDYIKLLPNSSNLLEVVMKYGETLYELGYWELAARTYQRAVADPYKNSPYYGQAINMIAQSYFKLGEYQKAEAWFQKLAEAFPDSTQYVEKARKMISSANFKVAEKLKDSGDLNQSALKFLTLAFSTKDVEIARAALVEAATQFEKAGDLDRAIKAYERMINEQPNISFIDEVYVKLGLLYEKRENWLRASDNYLKLVSVRPESKFAPRALLNAGNCFEQLKLWSKAKQIYQQYANSYANVNADDYIESCYKIGEMSLNMKDEDSALKEFARTVQVYNDLKRKNISVEEYLPAKAQFMIGEINFEKYQQVKLVPPLNVTLKKKKDLLQIVLQEYVTAGKFQVAEWTTASLYKTGLTFEDWADAFVNSPVPPELSPEEKQEYINGLQQQALPFRQKALEVYKANVTNAQRSNIQNEWVEQSKQRMEKLIIELGLGTTTNQSQQTSNQQIIPTSQVKGN